MAWLQGFLSNVGHVAECWLWVEVVFSKGLCIKESSIRPRSCHAFQDTLKAIPGTLGSRHPWRLTVLKRVAGPGPHIVQAFG